MHPPASELPPFGLTGRKSRRSQGIVIVRSGQVEYVDLPFALTRQYRLYHEAVSTFKTNRIDRMKFEPYS